MNRKAISLLIVVIMAFSFMIACQSPAAAPQAEPAAPVAAPASGEKPAEQAAAAPVEKPTVKIGAMFGLSGNNAYVGSEQQKAAELFVEQLNANEDYPLHIELIEMDDQTDANQGLACATKLATQDQVACLLGPWSTVCTAAVSEYLEDYKIPCVSIGATSDHLTQRGLQYYYRCTGNNAMQSIKTLVYMTQILGWKKMVVIYTSANDFSVNLYKDANDNAERMGLTILDNVEYESGTTDYTTIIAAIKALDYDGIYFTNSSQDDTANFLQQAVEMGISADQIYGLADTAKIAELLGTSADGYRTHCSFDTINPVTESAQKFGKSFQEKYGTVASFYAFNAAEALDVLTKALAAADTKDAAGIQSVLRSGNVFKDTLMGDLQFDETGETFPPFYVQQITDGKVKTIETTQYDEYRTFYYGA